MVMVLAIVVFAVGFVAARGINLARTFAFEGCGTINGTCLGAPIYGPLTPEACQVACKKHPLAVLFPDACHCGDASCAIYGKDCDDPCWAGGPMNPFGAPCPQDAPKIANIFAKFAVTKLVARDEYEYSAPDLAPAQSPTTPEIETSCTSVASPLPEITMPGSPPVQTVPQTLVTLTSTQCETSETLEQHATPLPATQASYETPCTSQSDETQNTPTQTAPVLQTPTDEAPEPKTFVNPTDSAPGAPVTSEPPMQTLDCSQSLPTQYSTPGSPQGYSEKLSSTSTDCTSRVEPSFSAVPSEITVWPSPSSMNKPYGDPPAPSQVQSSDSTLGKAMPLKTLGGFVLLAAMMI